MPGPRSRPRVTRAARAIALCVLAVAGTYLYASLLNETYAVRRWLIWPVALLWLYNAVLFGALLSAGHFVLTRVLRVVLPPLETLAVSFPVGVTIFCLLMYALGALGQFNLFSAVSLAGVLIGIGAPRLYRFSRRALQQWQLRVARHKPSLASSLVVALAGFFGAVCLALVYLPLLTPNSINFDAAWYHLSAAQDYARQGRIVGFEGDYNRSDPHLASLIHTWGWLMPVPGLLQRWTLPLHTEFCMVLATLVGVAALVSYLIAPQRARFAWVGFFLFPSIFVYDLNIGGSADHFLALFSPSMFLVAARAMSSLAPKHLALLGILVGGAVLTKYQAAYLAGPCGVLLCIGWLSRLRTWWKQRRRKQPSHLLGDGPSPWQALVLSPLLAVAVTAAVSSPLFIRNWVFHDNPVYPFMQEQLGGRPTLDNATWEVEYYLKTYEYRPHGTLGETLLESLKLFFTHSFVPHYSFTKSWPNFGSLFTLTLPWLLLIRGRRRIVMAAGVASLGIFAWAMLYRVDRNLQALVPLIAASTTAVLIRAWELGSFARVGITCLVGLQVLWGGDALFYSQEPRLKDAIGLITSGFRGRRKARNRYREAYTRVTEVLPRDAKVLIHPVPLCLGIDRTMVGDQPGHQGLIRYAGIGGGASLKRYYQRLGITHVVRHVRPSFSKRAEILLQEFFRSTPTMHFGGLTVGAVAEAAPGPDPPEYWVFSTGIRRYQDGLYALDDMDAFEGISPEVVRYAPPSTPMPPTAKRRKSLLGRASAALVGSGAELSPEERQVLERRFTQVEDYKDFSVYLKK